MNMTCPLPVVVQPRRRYARTCGLLALGLGAVLVRGVSAQRISTEYDHAVDFSAFKTFAIVDSTLRSSNPTLNSDLTKKHVDEALERAFVTRGLTRAGADAHLSVSYVLGALGRVENVRYPPGRHGRAPTVTTPPSVEGNLIVDVRDASNRSLVWRGVATEDEHDAAKVAEKLDKMIKKLIERYPARK